jgi:hypothetical protein
MPTLTTTPQFPAASNMPVRPIATTGAAPLVRLLATVALASAAAGGAAALALERLVATTRPPLLAPAAAAAPLLPVQTLPNLPAVHDVLRDRAEPPIEPPPAS